MTAKRPSGADHDAAAARISCTETVAAGSPCLEGHFPGDPIVPGVYVVDLVVEAVLRAAPRALRLACIDAVRFQRPLRPGVPLNIVAELDADGQARFQCRVEAGLVARGRLSFVPAP